LVKFNKYKDEKWMCGTNTNEESRGISERTIEESRKASLDKPILWEETLVKEQDETPMMRGDSPGDGGSHDPPPTCFTAGTPILLSDGTTKSIEKMEKGDLVLSYNEESGENQVCRVEETMAHEVD
jgi:hypothetical protein